MRTHRDIHLFAKSESALVYIFYFFIHQPGNSLNRKTGKETVKIPDTVSRIRMEDLWDTSRLLPEPAEDCLTQGKKAAESFREEYITQAFAAYILDKAKTLGADLSAEITVDKDGLPVFAEMQGIVDEETRQILEQILICDLGITKENQRWTGNPGNGG